MGSDGLNIKVLARVELDAWEEYQGCVRGIFVDDS